MEDANPSNVGNFVSGSASIDGQGNASKTTGMSGRANHESQFEASKLINDIKAGKHDELLFGMTNDDRLETIDALGTICNSIWVDNNNADEIPCKVSDVDDLINLNVDESTIPSDPIIQSMDINTKSTSYAGAAAASNGISLIATFIGKPDMLDLYTSSMCNASWGRNSFARCLIKVNSEVDLMDVVTVGIPSLYEDGFTKETIRVDYEWWPPRCDICKICGHVHEHCPKKVVNPPIVTTYNVFTPTVEKTNDGFQTVGKKKKRKGKSKSTNGGQFAGPSTIGKYSKKDHLSMSNSFSTLNDEEKDNEEDVENVYDESANLIQNTKDGGSSSFTPVPPMRHLPSMSVKTFGDEKLNPSAMKSGVTRVVAK
nr:hypothetical protein [Tanacetum cinerariifolium]